MHAPLVIDKVPPYPSPPVQDEEEEEEPNFFCCPPIPVFEPRRGAYPFLPSPLFVPWVTALLFRLEFIR